MPWPAVRRAPGFKTFASANRARLVFEPSPANNLQLHPEVNFNVFYALQATALTQYIDYSLVSESQHELGYWHSYFYPSRFYATWMALELLRGVQVLTHSRNAGIQYLLKSQHKNGSWGTPGNPYDSIGRLWTGRT